MDMENLEISVHQQFEGHSKSVKKSYQIWWRRHMTTNYCFNWKTFQRWPANQEREHSEEEEPYSIALKINLPSAKHWAGRGI